MKPTQTPARPALQADPRIVKKTRRNNAAYDSYGGLLGETDHDYMHQPARGPQTPPFPDFGRPGL